MTAPKPPPPADPHLLRVYLAARRLAAVRAQRDAARKLVLALRRRGEL